MQEITCPTCGSETAHDVACPGCGQVAVNGVAKPRWVKPPPPPELAGMVFTPIPPEMAEEFRRTFNEAAFLADMEETLKTGGETSTPSSPASSGRHMAATDPPAYYQVVYSAFVEKRLEELADEAIARGDGAAFTAALAEFRRLAAPLPAVWRPPDRPDGRDRHNLPRHYPATLDALRRLRGSTTGVLRRRPCYCRWPRRRQKGSAERCRDQRRIGRVDGVRFTPVGPAAPSIR